MPDDSLALTIEKRIDKGVLGGLPVAAGPGGSMSIAPRNMTELTEFAKLMAVAGDVIRPAFRQNAGACLALCLQAFRWGADPFAVANKAYLTRNKAGETQIAYEAQLIDAIVHTSGVLSKRLRLAYAGQGNTRKCIVTGWIKGEDEPFEYESPTVAEITVKNSPLWTADRDQQLAYYSKRAWARRHVPEILLGIYTTDEIDGQIIDVTAERIDSHAAAMQEAEPTKSFVWEAAYHTGEVVEFRTPENAIEACRKILIAAANIGPDAISAAWENNEGLRMTLREAEYGSDADALDRLYNELAPSQTLETDAEQTSQGGEPAETPAAADEALAAAAGPTPDETASEAAHDQPQQAKPTPAATPATATASNAPSGPQTADRHDPFWDRASLKIDAMPLRGGGSLNKLDWKTWPALLTPRIRQAWSVQLLNALHEDNADGLATYASTVGQRDADEITALFEDARAKLS